MTITLAFFHGEQVLVGLALAVVIVLVVVPLLLYFWLWHSRISELKLALAYFAVVAATCAEVFLNPSNPTSLSSITAFLLGLILTLPWSAVAFFATMSASGERVSEQLFALAIAFCGVINAFLLYLIAKKLRRLINPTGPVKVHRLITPTEGEK